MLSYHLFIDFATSYYKKLQSNNYQHIKANLIKQMERYSDS